MTQRWKFRLITQIWAWDNMEEYEILVPLESAGQRVDKFLSDNFSELSRSYIHKLIDDNMVEVNTSIVGKNKKISEGEIVKIRIPDPQEIEIVPENIPLDIIYEDDDLLVVNKPKNMVVHPAPGNYSGTLVNALMYHCKDSLSGINGVMRPGIVHRIDKNTTGLLVVAKNDFAHKFLAEQIKEHSFVREYEAIICGHLKDDSGTIKTNIGRSKTDRKKMAVVPIGGKRAVTHYEVVARYDKYDHIKLKLETGRTHQIRVHMAYKNHPILGDDVYGGAVKNEFDFLQGQCLHARTLGFVHPSSGENMLFTSELPEYFKKILTVLSSQ